MSITPVYASLLAFIFLGLSVRVIRARRRNRVLIGDGGVSELQLRCRAHGNFIEYVPLVLILMAMAEFQQAPAQMLHLIGSLLILGRLLHAYGISTSQGNIRFRVTGMAMTFVALITGALASLGVSGLLSSFI